MITVEKDGRTFALRNENQLSAFLNSGWKEVVAKKATSTTTETVEEVKETKSKKSSKVED